MANNESDERRAKLEAAYETQKAVFDSALSHYLVADGGRNVQKFGSIGKEATYADFQTALNNDSNIASSFLNADNKAGELYGGAVTSLEVLQRGAAFYATSVKGVTVRDVVSGLDGVVPEGLVSEEIAGLFMAELEEQDEALYKALHQSLVSYIISSGVGDSIREQGAKAVRGGLEALLDKRNNPTPAVAA